LVCRRATREDAGEEGDGKEAFAGLVGWEEEEEEEEEEAS
jgi:hypothetical protein